MIEGHLNNSNLTEDFGDCPAPEEQMGFQFWEYQRWLHQNPQLEIPEIESPEDIQRNSELLRQCVDLERVTKVTDDGLPGF